jgi:hypothetical protein
MRRPLNSLLNFIARTQPPRAFTGTTTLDAIRMPPVSPKTLQYYNNHQEIVNELP